jgi:hypothetical protein
MATTRKLAGICLLPLAVLIASGIATCTDARADITDLSTWTKVANPPHFGMSGTIENPSAVKLIAAPNPPNAIPAGTDIGFQSVNGSRVGDSTQGAYFSATDDFHVAIDYNIEAIESIGLGGIGFGIGEDQEGANSAGVGLGIFDGSPTLYGGAARINDADESPLLFTTPPSTSGRFFVRYDSLSGDVTTGISTVLGSLVPEETQTFPGIQNNWDDRQLFVSFFLRSDSVNLIGPLEGGTLTATFSNMEVLAGTPLGVPEPGAIALLLVSGIGLGLALWRKQQHRT